MFGVDLKPKWFPVFFVLSRGEAKTITSIAKEIGHSHPSVSNIIKEMVAKGLVKETKDKSDGRRNMVMLSAKGKRMSDSFAEQSIDVTSAIRANNCSKPGTIFGRRLKNGRIFCRISLCWSG